MPLLIAMLCLGAYAMLAQMLVMREMLVVFLGNELSIGVAFGAWLLAIGLGAGIARLWIDRPTLHTLRWTMVCMLCWLALVLPLQIWILRILRSLLAVPVGEYVPLPAMAIASWLILLPSCGITGMVFPYACRLVARNEPFAVSRIYLVESIGATVGGAGFVFLLAGRWSALRMVFSASLLVLIGAAILAPGRRFRRVTGVFILAVATLIACPRCLQPLEWGSLQARWRAFRVLPSLGDTHQGGELIESMDSRYQNLAIIRTGEQFTLYGNGEVLSIFPDKPGYENTVHFIMAQNPRARRVLLIGGNPIGLIPELCRYPIERVEYVEMDAAIGQILRRAAGDEYRRAVADSRVAVQVMDGPRYVKNCREFFDVILVLAPLPTTAALNRYFTVDFYRDARRLLAPGGFVYTSLEASERLERLAIPAAASVYRSLSDVFGVVMVTAGTPTQYFASEVNGPLTFDREELYRRSSLIKLDTRYFRPEYFRFADEISPEKTADVLVRIARAHAPLNTNLRPVVYFDNLMLLSRLSGSRFETVLLNAAVWGRENSGWPGWTVSALVLALLVLMCVMWRRRASRACVPVTMQWTRFASTLAIFMTGFVTMTMEVIFILVFQNLYGYVYAQMGLIVAFFMLGLVIGARNGQALERGTVLRMVQWLIALECAMLLLAFSVPAAVQLASLTGLTLARQYWIEASLYIMVICSGWIGGAQFPLVNRIVITCGKTLGTSAAVTDALDHVGAAVGSLVAGLFWLPVFGLTGACWLLALVQAIGVASLLVAMAGESDALSGKSFDPTPPAI